MILFLVSGCSQESFRNVKNAHSDFAVGEIYEFFPKVQDLCVARESTLYFIIDLVDSNYKIDPIESSFMIEFTVDSTQVEFPRFRIVNPDGTFYEKESLSSITATRINAGKVEANMFEEVNKIDNFKIFRSHEARLRIKESWDLSEIEVKARVLDVKKEGACVDSMVWRITHTENIPIGFKLDKEDTIKDDSFLMSSTFTYHGIPTYAYPNLAVTEFLKSIPYKDSPAGISSQPFTFILTESGFDDSHKTTQEAEDWKSYPSGHMIRQDFVIGVDSIGGPNYILRRDFNGVVKIRKKHNESFIN